MPGSRAGGRLIALYLGTRRTTASCGNAPDGRAGSMMEKSYGQSFAIYALSEYVAPGHRGCAGLSYAGRVFDPLQKYAADTCHGGYFGIHAGD